MVRGFCIVGSETARTDTTWEQPWGERRLVKDNHNEVLVRLEQNGHYAGRRMTVRFRLFNNGAGFRYELPEQPGLKTMKIAGEWTEFDVVQPGTACWITGGEWSRYKQICQKTPIDAASTAHTLITMRLDGGTHSTVPEAALVDYCAIWFKRGEGRLFRSTLSSASRGAWMVCDLPPNTPWLTIRIVGSASGLVENDLELNLNQPNSSAMSAGSNR